MQIKKTLCLLLCFAMLMSMLAGCGNADQTNKPGQAEASNSAAGEGASAFPVMEGPVPSSEYARGIWYGFLQESLMDADPDTTIVTWKQYCTMLANMIKAYDETLLPEWETMTKDAPDTEMKRDGAAIALLFAGQVSDRYYCNADPNALYRDGFDWGSQFNFNYPIFDWNQKVKPLDDNMQVFNRSNAIASAYWYLLGRISVLTGLPLLDVTDSDPQLKDALTLGDALVSVVRLYESDEDVALETSEKLLELVKATPEAQQIISAAEERKKKILESETEIEHSDTFIQGQTYTGTAYYVSNNGQDGADGRSPETAWATLERLGKAKLKAGDAVFFERGSLWRKAELPRSVRYCEGLTLSAYGEGEKPRFYGSPESGVGAEKWELFHEGENGEKIWVFYNKMPDCGGIVLNGRELIRRDVAFWDGEGFLCLDDFSVPYRPEEQLENLELFCQLPYEQAPKDKELVESERLGLAYYMDENWNPLMGTLYVRCDQGNPGELFEDVEFMAAYAAIDGLGQGITLDNLCFRYSSKTITGGYFAGVSNDSLLFQNCEVGFLGGALNWFSWAQNAADFGHAHLDGGGLNINGNSSTIRSCYTHHCFQEGIALEGFDGDGDPNFGNRIEDNLVEYCMFGLGVGNWETEADSAHEILDLEVKNNYVLYSGFESTYNVRIPVKSIEEYGEFHWPSRIGLLPLDCAAITMHKAGENTQIQDNVFAFASALLIGADDMYEGALPILEGNTYAQLPGVAILGGLIDPWGPRVTEMDNDVAVREILGDETGTIVTFQ